MSEQKRKVYNKYVDKSTEELEKEYKQIIARRKYFMSMYNENNNLRYLEAVIEHQKLCYAYRQELYLRKYAGKRLDGDKPKYMRMPAYQLFGKRYKDLNSHEKYLYGLFVMKNKRERETKGEM